MRLQKIKGYQFLVFVLLLVIAACKKDQVDNDFTLSRQFSVGNIRQTIAETSAKLEWDPSLFTQPGNVQYTVQVAKDSLFTGTIDLTKVVDSAGIMLKEGEIEIQQNYYARVKANGANGAADSKWIVSGRFSITGEQILQNIDPVNDVTANSVTLRWRTPSNVTHFMLGTTRYNISPAENTAGIKTITGLAQSRDYVAMLYANAAIRGTKSFKTLSNLPTGPNVVRVGPNDDLAALIQNASNGAIFVVLQGTKYNSEAAVTFPAGISFTIFGEEGAVKPIISFNGITLPATAGTIKFQNIDFTGYKDGDATTAKRNYIFNQSTVSATQEINFDNCTIRNFVNTPMRLQSSNAISISRFIINNCIVSDIGDNNSNGTYAFINTNVATGIISNITITNSTFYKLGYGLILHSSSPSTSVVIENNTFNNITGNGRYFIDYNTRTVGTFTFKNNIIGKALSPANTARGIRYSGSNLVVENSYQTSDNAISANPIPNIMDYAQPSTGIFTDPDAGNFLIKDNAFGGRSTAGDPRWRL